MAETKKAKLTIGSEATKESLKEFIENMKAEGVEVEIITRWNWWQRSSIDLLTFILLITVIPLSEKYIGDIGWYIVAAFFSSMIVDKYIP